MRKLSQVLLQVVVQRAEAVGAHAREALLFRVKGRASLLLQRPLRSKHRLLGLVNKQRELKQHLATSLSVFTVRCELRLKCTLPLQQVAVKLHV